MDKERAIWYKKTMRGKRAMSTEQTRYKERTIQQKTILKK